MTMIKATVWNPSTLRLVRRCVVVCRIVAQDNNGKEVVLACNLNEEPAETLFKELRRICELDTKGSEGALQRPNWKR